MQARWDNAEFPNVDKIEEKAGARIWSPGGRLRFAVAFLRGDCYNISCVILRSEGGILVPQIDRAERRADWKQFMKLLLAIAIPVALQNLLSTTASMIDTLMLAQLDEHAKGAVGLCAKYSSLMFSGYWGFVGGGMLFMSQYWGARDEKGLCRAYGITLTFMMAVGLLFAGVAVAAPMTVMRLLTNQEVFWEIGADYLRIAGAAYVLQVFSMAMSCLLRSTERVRIPLFASIVSLLTNLAVNYVLIFGKLGLPALGVKGAAIGTVVAGVVNVAMVAILCGATKYPYLSRVKAHFSWSGAFVKQYLQKCFPIIMNEVLIGIGNFVVGLVMGRQSTEAINALAIFNVFEGFVISFFSGFTNASSILVGKEVGAGNHETAYVRAKRLAWLTPAVVFTACSLFLCFHRPLLLAMKLQGETYDIARGMLFIFTVAATIRMTNWIHNDTFRAAGDPTIGTVLEIAFMYLLVIPTVVLTGLVWRVPALVVFACIYIDEPIRVVLMLRHMFSGKWVRPVTEEGRKTLPAFCAAHGIPVPKESVAKA